MAITKAAKKSNKRSLKLRDRNLVFKKDMKVAIKMLKKTVASWDKSAIDSNLQKVYSSIDRAAKRNIIHKNNASRKKSRLTKLAYSIK